jgi:uncharacterized protein (TIGR03083 family)
VPTSLSLDQHLDALDTAGARLIALAADTGFDAPVPTCPAWDAGDLVAHQAMVHRWATANVTGADPDAVTNQTEIRSSVSDLTGYFDEGRAALAAALRAAPPDLEATRFLNDAPAPREFWARRQAHETTIHMVDALAASTGRVPTTAESAVPAELAADGLDELLRGFFTRGRSKLFTGEEYTIVVTPSDAPRRWVVRVAEKLTVDPGDGELDTSADAAITGTAAELYLALWNRGDAVGGTGRPGVLEQWHATQRVRWS